MKTFDSNNIVRKNIHLMEAYASARDEFTGNSKKMIFLDANENPFQNGVNRYPDPQQIEVKKKLSVLKKVPTNQILLGNGSDEVLDLLFRAFCEPKIDNVITLPPTYGMYSVLANLNAVKNKEIILDANFQPDVPKILANIDKNTKIIFICSPNNPTANIIESTYIEDLIQKFNGIIVIDEAYIEFSKNESWLTKLNDFPNLVITQTLSKAYGLAGVRLGILYASTQIITILNKIKPPYNINQLTQNKVLKVLEKADVLKNEINLILSEKKVLFKQLLQIKFILKIYPSDANFILIKVDDAHLRYQQLLKNGIVVRNRSSQALCENTLRITIGTNAENKKLIKILKEL